MKKVLFSILILLLFITPFVDVFAIESSDVPYGSTVYINGVNGMNELYTNQACDAAHNVANEGMYCLMMAKHRANNSYTFTKRYLDEVNENGNYVIHKGSDVYTITHEQKLKLLAVLIDPAFNRLETTYGEVASKAIKQGLVWYILGQKRYEFMESDEPLLKDAIDNILNTLGADYLQKTYYKYDLNYYSTTNDEVQDVLGGPVLYPSISFEKVDESNNALSGVEFTVYELVGNVPKNSGVIDANATKAAIQAGTITLKPNKVFLAKQVSGSDEYIGENSKFNSLTNKLNIYFTNINGNFMIRETRALNGYDNADDVFLSISNRKITSSSGNSIKVVNRRTVSNPEPETPNDFYVGFKKVDDGGKVLSGAKMKLIELTLDDEGRIPFDDNKEDFSIARSVDEWTSNDKIHFVKLSRGLYSLVETNPPSGYKVSLPIYFYVDENGLVSSVTILPTDSDSLYSYKLGSKIGDGTDFSLTEERADAIISMIDNKVPAVIADNPVEENIKEAPKTGSIHVIISLILLAISIITIGVSFVLGRKKGKI